MQQDNELKNIDTASMYSRTEVIIPREKLDKIKMAKILICGVGGVGSYALEALARIGVGNIYILDKDIVDPTNINRQLVASWYTVGMAKAEIGAVHVETVNPKCNVVSYVEYINPANVDKYITRDLDYVIDAIDSIDSKIAVISKCKELGVKVISSMGMGNRMDPTKIKIADISKTTMCPLARIVRKRLKDSGITNLKVVFSDEEPIKTKEHKLGSLPFVPSVAGLYMAYEVVKDIINE